MLSNSFRLASAVSAATIQDCNRGAGDLRMRRERIRCAHASPWRKEICYRRTLGRALVTRPCWQLFANGWGNKNDSRLGRAKRSPRRRRKGGLGASQRAGLLSQPDTTSWTPRWICRVGGVVEGVLRSGTAELELGAITAAYLRPYDSARLPGLADATPEVAARVAGVNDAMLCWSELTSARVVNRPSAMASNQSKLHQLALIYAQGFRVPETIATTDAAELESFWDRHGEIIYKSISGVRSIVSRLTPEHRARFGDLAHSPVQFQQWIPGHDVRVHVAGDEVFASDVDLSAIDYRYPRSEEEVPRIAACDLPRELADRAAG